MRHRLVLMALLLSGALAACGDNDGVAKPTPTPTAQKRLLHFFSGSVSCISYHPLSRPSG